MTKLIFARLLLVAMAILTLAAASFADSFYTSMSDGTRIPSDLFPAKSTVYANGSAQLANGIYYFQVTGPNDSDLLSTDPAANRQLMVYNGNIMGVGTYYSSANGPAPGATSYLGQSLPVGTHTEGTYDASSTSVAVQLLPFANTMNPGGEYKVWLIPRINPDGSVDTNTTVQSDGLHLNFKNNQASTHTFKILNSQTNPTGTLIIQKYDDLNDNGVLDNGEPPLNGFQFHVVINGGGSPITDFVVTSGDDGAGVADVELNPGDNYTVTEVLTSNQIANYWQQTQPAGNANYNGTFSLGPVTTLFGNFMGSACMITVACPPNLTGANALQCYASVPAPATDYPSFVAQGGTATDSCNAAVTVKWVSDQESNPGSSCGNTITRTYVVTANDNDATPVTCTQTIYVNNTTPPTITCPKPVTVSCFANIPSPATDLSSFTLLGGSASANCATDTLTFSWSGDSASNQQSNCNNTITRTYKVVDDCGNVGTCTQTITVNNSTPPSVTPPTDVNVSCFSSVPTPVTSLSAFQALGGTATGTCANDTLTVAWVSDAASAGTSNCSNSITRTYTITDECGNVATTTQTINVNNTTPPVVTAPTAVSVQCYSEVPTAATTLAGYQAIGGTATGTCTNDTLTVTSSDSPSNGTSNCKNTITRTYTITDECGNAATATQTITVNNTTPPTVTGPTAVSVQCYSSVPPIVSSLSGFQGIGGTATGTCTNDTLTVTWVSDSPSNGSSNCNNTITRTYKVTDECGNAATATQTITVNNTTPPKVTAPAGFTVQCLGNVPAPAGSLGTFLAAGGTATGTCANSVITITSTDSYSNPGSNCNNTLTRTYKATDECGNSATATQVITINNTTAPTIVCPAPVTVQLTAGQCTASPLLGIPTGHDYCGGNVQFSNNAPSSFSPGVYLVTWTATDSCGNKATCTQTVTIYTSVSGTKFFGVPNGSGGFTTPAVVSGYKIQLLSGSTVMATTYTNSSGNYFFGGLLPGTYTIREVNPNGNWENITPPSVGPFSLTCGLSVNFENACDTPLTNGLSKGFWSNKNGEAVLQAHDPAWRTLLNGLNLRNANGSTFTVSTTASFASAFSSFESWIGSANATNMANMLSAQLAACALNVAYNGLNANAYIVVPHADAVALGLPEFVSGDGYMTIGMLESLSVTSLGANGYTVGGSAAKTYQGVLEGLLDSVDNDAINQLSGAPCPFGSY